MIEKTKTPKADQLIAEMSTITDMEVRDNSGMGFGEVAHQGDVYIVRVQKRYDIYKIHEDVWPRCKKHGALTDSRQLVPGNTKGSRHIVDGEDLKVYACPAEGSPLEGPTIEATGEWTLTHPEHAHHKFGPGTYVTIFQRDFSERGQVKAVRD